MDRLAELQSEDELTTRLMAYPLDIAEYFRLKERRQAMLREARQIVQSLNDSEPQWLSLLIR